MQIIVTMSTRPKCQFLIGMVLKPDLSEREYGEFVEACQVLIGMVLKLLTL